jgi:hypothetical protein
VRDTFTNTEADAAAFERACAEPTGEPLDYYPDQPEVVDCPACGGDSYPLGTLGRREHFRCRDCGMDSSRVEVEAAIDQDVQAQIADCFPEPVEADDYPF